MLPTLSQSEREAIREVENSLYIAWQAVRGAQMAMDEEQREHNLRIARRCFRKLLICDASFGPFGAVEAMEPIPDDAIAE